MNEQAEMFSTTQHDGHVTMTPNSRPSDPSSSHSAGEEITASGKRVKQMVLIVETVKDNPGLTSLELSTKLKLDRHQVARRLPDAEHICLMRKGAIRKCGIGGRDSVTWFAV